MLSSFASQPWSIFAFFWKDSKFLTRDATLKHFFNSKCPPVPRLIVRVHIVWFLPIESWNVSDFPLPWPMFLFWLNASQQQKWNTVLFRGYTDIDNIFQINVNIILAFSCNLERLPLNVNGSFYARPILNEIWKSLRIFWSDESNFISVSPLHPGWHRIKPSPVLLLQLCNGKNLRPLITKQTFTSG